MVPKQTNSPTVSLVVPCYNVEKYISECLDSAVNQTLQDIEIICVNDGSTDGTLAILESYAASDSRVKIISKPNGGYGETMNRGIDAALGEYVGFLESDDYIALDTLEVLYRTAKDLGDLDFVKSDFYRFLTLPNGEKDIWRDDIDATGEYYGKVLNPQDDCRLFDLQMMTWTGIYRKDFLDAHTIRHHESPGASYQDNGFWFQTFAWGERISVVHKPFYYYRQDNENSSINQNNKVYAMFEEYGWIQNKLSRRFDEKPELLGIFHYKKTHNLNFIMWLLAPRFRSEFLERYAQEYRAAEAAHEINWELFWPHEEKDLRLIMSDPGAFEKEMEKREQESACLASAKEKGLLALLFAHIKIDGPMPTLKMAVKKIFG